MKSLRVFLTFLCMGITTPFSGCSTTENILLPDIAKNAALLVEAKDSGTSGTEVLFWADRVIETRSLIETDENVFYISEAGIEKYDKTNDSILVLVVSKKISMFCIENGFIYYCEEGHTIYSIDVNGLNNTKILESGDIDSSIRTAHFARLFVFGEYLYCSLESNIMYYFKYSLLSHEVDLFVDDAGYMVFLDNFFYYIEHAGRSWSIFRKELSSGQVELLRGDGEYNKDKPYSGVPMIDGIFLVDGQIFYTTRFPAAVFRLEDDGEDVMISDFGRPENRDQDFADACIGLHNLYFGNTYEHKDVLYEYDLTNGEIKEYYRPTDMYYWYEAKVVNGYIIYAVSRNPYRIEYNQLSI